jgi:hypothetical protein
LGLEENDKKQKFFETLTRTVEEGEEKLGAADLIGLVLLLFEISSPADRLTR